MGVGGCLLGLASSAGTLLKSIAAGVTGSVIVPVTLLASRFGERYLVEHYLVHLLASQTSGTGSTLLLLL